MKKKTVYETFKLLLKIFLNFTSYSPDKNTEHFGTHKVTYEWLNVYSCTQSRANMR